MCVRVCVRVSSTTPDHRDFTSPADCGVWTHAHFYTYLRPWLLTCVCVCVCVCVRVCVCACVFGRATYAAGPAHHGLDSSPIGVPIGDAIRRIRRCIPCVRVCVRVSSTTPDEWENFSNRNITETDKQCQNSAALRVMVDRLLQTT